MSTLPSDVLDIQYSSLGDDPAERLLCLRLVHRLLRKPEGLYTRSRLHIQRNAWNQLISWVQRANPAQLRVEQDAIRILNRYSGHVLIGTKTLIQDLEETLDSLEAPPTLQEIWAASSLAANT